MNTICPGSELLGLGLSRSTTTDECICCGKVIRLDPTTYTIRPHEGATS